MLQILQHRGVTGYLPARLVELCAVDASWKVLTKSLPNLWNKYNRNKDADGFINIQT